MKSLVSLALGLVLFFAATTASAQNPDLSVSLSASPPSPNPGDRITFNGQVTNHGPGAIQLDAEIRLPAGYEPVSTSSTAGKIHSEHPTGALVTDALLAAGASFTYSASAQLPLNATPGTILTGEAEVFPKAPEADPSNNFAMASMTVATPSSADLAITMTDGSTTTATGGQADYVLTVSNTGPDTADATLTFPLPAALTMVSLSMPARWRCTIPAVGMSGTITCQGSALPPGASIPFTVKTKLHASIPLGTQIASTATVSSTTTDPVPNNNSVTDTNTVVAALIAAVPTLTEWAMILLGTLLAGGAALHLQPRRRSA